MRPTVPVWPPDAATFRRDRAELDKAVRSVAPSMGWYADRTAPYPLTLGAPDAALLDRLYRAIAVGIERVIARYLSDGRLRRVLALPGPLVELLERVDGLPYRTGALRPDFLIDVDGVAQVCEVNARFPTNGFLCSYYTNEVVEGLGYLTGAAVRAVVGLRQAIDALASRFEPGPLVVLLDREGGNEIFLLVDELRRVGIDARARRPDQLRVERGVIVDGSEPVAQFILELERDELLEMPPDLFAALVACDRTFNDVRTLILGHDKRMLAVLGDRSIMSDLLDPASVDVLSDHIIPTFHAGDPSIADRLRAEPADWVLKRNSSGRGIDLLVGAACDPPTWLHAVEHESDDRAAQAFVPQLVVPMPMLTDAGELVEQPAHVVGLLPGFDGVPFGPGLFRASAESVINVAGDRAVLVPTMIATEPAR
ncbi:MAG: hypothetical protein ACR2HQ_10065 [Ilumatobacteraceae bacterium]